MLELLISLDDQACQQMTCHFQLSLQCNYPGLCKVTEILSLMLLIAEMMAVFFIVALILILFMLLFKFLFKRKEPTQIGQATSGGEGRDELVTGRESQ